MKEITYNWTLKDAQFTKDKGTVFSCFSCGRGSTMGYKLAGYDVIGCNEIDPRMISIYRENHNPKYSFCEPIQEFKKRKYLPKELYNLDILDGSPPCSSFSISGNRAKDWNKHIPSAVDEVLNGIKDLEWEENQTFGLIAKTEVNLYCIEETKQGVFVYTLLMSDFYEQVPSVEEAKRLANENYRGKIKQILGL